MHFRRHIALSVGALVLAAPALSSCGFNYATDRVNTISQGVSNQDKDVDVLGAVIVADRANSGTFIATFSNNSGTEPATFEALSGAEGNTVTAGDFAPIEIAPSGFVNLASPDGPGGVRLTGEFEAGDFVPVSVGFANGDRVTLKVPVVTACGDYAGLDNAPVVPSREIDATGALPSDEATSYSCDYPTSAGHPGPGAE